MEQIQQKPA
ncbi:hypothetical protein SAMN04244547_05019 [Azotobacter vinelandii]|nr:hypothetical protein SAMN04244547_05019 [Azotobacter vinelandii]